MARLPALAGMAAATAAAVAAVAAPATALADDASTHSVNGHDVSWPQCSTSLPGVGGLGIVGVNDGRAWSANPCLSAEYRWAARAPRTPDVYLNTANPAPQSSYYWPASGARDPVLCVDATSTSDPGCAYDYGWHTAAAAYAATGRTLGSRSPISYWWLDVETMNTWNGDVWSNAADIQGSIDYLMSQGVAGVGVYSTEEQWDIVTGGYTSSSASQYVAHWAPEFTSTTGIATSPSWVAGASGPVDAQAACSGSFLGTTTWLVQYVVRNHDVDHLCGVSASAPSGATPAPAITAPASEPAPPAVPVWTVRGGAIESQ